MDHELKKVNHKIDSLFQLANDQTKDIDSIKNSLNILIELVNNRWSSQPNVNVSASSSDSQSSSSSSSSSSTSSSSTIDVTHYSSKPPTPSSEPYIRRAPAPHPSNNGPNSIYQQNGDAKLSTSPMYLNGHTANATTIPEVINTESSPQSTTIGAERKSFYSSVNNGIGSPLPTTSVSMSTKSKNPPADVISSSRSQRSSLVIAPTSSNSSLNSSLKEKLSLSKSTAVSSSSNLSLQEKFSPSMSKSVPSSPNSSLQEKLPQIMSTVVPSKLKTTKLVANPKTETSVTNPIDLDDSSAPPSVAKIADFKSPPTFSASRIKNNAKDEIAIAPAVAMTPRLPSPVMTITQNDSLSTAAWADKIPFPSITSATGIELHTRGFHLPETSTFEQVFEQWHKGNELKRIEPLKFWKKPERLFLYKYVSGNLIGKSLKDAYSRRSIIIKEYELLGKEKFEQHYLYTLKREGGKYFAKLISAIKMAKKNRRLTPAAMASEWLAAHGSDHDKGNPKSLPVIVNNVDKNNENISTIYNPTPKAAIVNGSAENKRAQRVLPSMNDNSKVDITNPAVATRSNGDSSFESKRFRRDYSPETYNNYGTPEAEAGRLHSQPPQAITKTPSPGYKTLEEIRLSQRLEKLEMERQFQYRPPSSLSALPSSATVGSLPPPPPPPSNSQRQLQHHFPQGQSQHRPSIHHRHHHDHPRHRPQPHRNEFSNHNTNQLQ